MSTSSTPKIKTRILIISDTHGVKPKPKPDIQDAPSTEDELLEDESSRRPRYPSGYREPLAEADVLLHCGDLTKRSSVSEFQDTFAMLRNAKAPLKLVIAGNHDLALDERFWYEDYKGPESVAQAANKIIQESEAYGVHYLTEGVHEFDLDNGAHLKVYASPHTPAFGGWGFQYHNGHKFDIPPGIDIAMTHGPPEGILDYADMTSSHAGCPDLLAAVAKAKPRVHCFGHIHEAWGMVDALWKDNPDGVSVVDEEHSKGVKAGDLRPTPGDDQKKLEEARKDWIEYSRQRGILVDMTDKEDAVENRRTLFLNAAIMDMRYRPVHMPWLVDIALQKSSAPTT